MSYRAAVTRLGYCIAIAVLASIAGGSVAVAGSGRSSSCTAGYAYAGAVSPVAGSATATITALAQPPVDQGHIAAWIGVGGPGLGPGGSDEWLQAGIARVAGEEPTLYYEVKRPQDDGVRFVTVGRVARGASHRFVVNEFARDTWVATIDGVHVSAPVALPGSHGVFHPVATTENWDGDVQGTCNRYEFAFSNLSVRAGRAWQPFVLTQLLRDPAYTLVLRPGGFTVASR